MRKFRFILFASALAFSTTSAHAASLVSVTCSLNSIVMTFNGVASISEVDDVKIGERANARIKRSLSAAFPLQASGSQLTLVQNTKSRGETKKVAPWNAYIFVEGASSGSAKCNS